MMYQDSESIFQLECAEQNFGAPKAVGRFFPELKRDFEDLSRFGRKVVVLYPTRLPAVREGRINSGRLCSAVSRRSRRHPEASEDRLEVVSFSAIPSLPTFIKGRD